MSEDRLKWAHGLRVKVKDHFNRSRVLLGVTRPTHGKPYASPTRRYWIDRNSNTRL